MMKQKIQLAIILFTLGFIGVLSMLTMDIPLPAEVEAMLSENFSPQQIKLILLVNPTIILIITLVVGTIVYSKANFAVPIIEKIVGINNHEIDYKGILKNGILYGIISGILLSLVASWFVPVLPTEFNELGKNFQPNIAVRFLYGGFTEEILMRFGVMSFIVWLSSIIFRSTKPLIYISGIFISALLFALGHFPIAFQILEEPSPLLLTYILIANSIGGIIFGWLYWKKGLESAFIAHIFTHVILLLAENLIS